MYDNAADLDLDPYYDPDYGRDLDDDDEDERRPGESR